MAMYRVREHEMKTITRAKKGMMIVPDFWNNSRRYRITKAQIKREEKLRRWLEAEKARGDENGLRV